MNSAKRTYLSVFILLISLQFCSCKDLLFSKPQECRPLLIHVPYKSKKGNYMLIYNKYIPSDNYKLTISSTDNDSSFLPLIKFVQKASQNNSLNPMGLVFYSTDSNVISFLNNDCNSTKAVNIFEKYGNRIRYRLFVKNSNGIFWEDKTQEKLAANIQFKYIHHELMDNIKKRFPDIMAYHLFTTKSHKTHK